MRVIRVAEFGGPEVLRGEDVPDVVPGPGQVVVDVAVAGVLSVDAAIRAGQGGEYFPVRPPYVPGAGVAGTVAATGEGVSRSWTGRRVLAELDGGGYAERAVADAEALIPIPDTLGSPEAMALLHDGSTALALFEAVDVRPGESVLVQPAAGGLGSLLVQLAHLRGAHVIAAARGAEKLALAARLGADATVDYSVPGWEVKGVNVAFDGVGGILGRTAFEAVGPGGRYSSYGWSGGPPPAITREEARRRGVHVRGMEQLASFAPGRKTLATRMLTEAASGRITPVIGRTFTLDQAAEAHAALEGRGVVGKALLVIGSRG